LLQSLPHHDDERNAAIVAAYANGARAIASSFPNIRGCEYIAIGV